MTNRRLALHTLAGALALPALHPTLAQPMTEDSDPHLWLEDVEGDRALAWVRQRNAETEQALESVPGHDARRRAILEVLDSRDRIPAVGRIGPHLYNLWQDAANPRGLWRRATLAEYRKPKPAWETVLDIDALGKSEGVNWVFAGVIAFGPEYRRCMVLLSRGGADARVAREFDLSTRRFVDGGFSLPEAKSDLSWLDADTLVVGTDFGPGSLTDSGYPRVFRRWKRGTALADAPVVFEGLKSDVSADVTVIRTPGFERVVFGRSPGFFDSLLFLQQGERLVPIDKPIDAGFSFWRDRVLIQLRSDWAVGGRTHPRGSLLVADAEAYLKGERQLTPLFTPTASRSLQGWVTTRTTVLLDVLDTVIGKVEEWHADASGWRRREVALPGVGSVSIASLHDPLLADDPLAERYFFRTTDFLQPDTLFLARAGSDAHEAVKSLPAFFDAGRMRVEQRFARSKDGTRVPYFVVWPRKPRDDGRNPTLLYGYGGFEVSMTPWYLGSFGRTWLHDGGVFVVANIRGGGEFGPQWHQAAVGARKQASYDDFAAVAEDLAATGVTRPRHLGILGGSNGGLLVGAVMVQRPELFGAAVCQVPLLDMKRYHRLLAGASWMSEYGDPDKVEDWAGMRRWSPYQNVRRGARMPPVLFTTSTRDDRVHPGHARKMAARMLEQDHAVLYWENVEGGHGGAADNAQRARMVALERSFLWRELAPPR